MPQRVVGENMSKFSRESRYVVLKGRDVHLGLNKAERVELEALCSKVDQYRASVGRPPLICAVVEADWPEYEPTWKAIEERMEQEREDNGQFGVGA
mgnify:CR=1 FL=1